MNKGKKTESLRLRLNEAQKKTLKDKADKKGMTLTRYIEIKLEIDHL